MRTRATGGKRWRYRFRSRMRLVENAAETFRDRLTNSRPASTLIPGTESFAAGGLASLAITSMREGLGAGEGRGND